MATKRVNIDIVAKDKSQQALNKVRGNLDGVKKAVFNVRNALAGLGAGLVIRNIVNTGKEIEGLQVRLKFLFGSVEEGAKAFDKMAEFASRVPFSLQEIQAGSGNLAVVAKDADELANLMEITGNVAAATGLDFRTTAEQIQRSFSAGIGAADLFRDRGVRAMLGFKAGATVSIDETVKRFEQVFGAGGEFGGTTEALAQTLEGTLSMIGDKVFTFKKTLLDAGFFAELKNQFGDLDQFLQDNAETLDELAIAIGKGLADAVRISADAIIFIKDNFNLFVETIKLLISFKVAGIFIGLAGGILKANSAMLLFNATIKRNLFIAGAAIVISQFDKILDMLGKLPSDFDNASAAIAHNNEQINHYTKQLSLANSHLEQLKKQYGENTKIKEHQDQIKDASDLVQEYTDKLKELKALNDDIFKDSYPVYEDRILRLVGAIKKETDAVKKNTDTKKDLNHDYLNETLDEFRKELEEEKKKEEEINKILQENRLKGIQIFHDMQQEKERIYNESKILEINNENEKAKKLREINKNNFHKMLDDALKFESEKARLREEGKQHAISESRSALEELSKVNRTAFQAFKAVRIAEATINAYKGASMALATYPPPFSFIAAAASVAKGLALVAQIKSSNFRAGGGSVNKDQAYMVGEKGAEMFVPSGSGKIVPNHQLSNGKPVTVNFNINTVDARGFNELLVNSRGVIINMINSAVNEKGKMAIV